MVSALRSHGRDSDHAAPRAPAHWSPMKPAEEEPMLSGQATLDFRWACEQVIGSEATERAIASLPESARRRYGELTPLTWVDYETVRLANDAFAREGERTIDALYEEVIPRAMERSFRTVWRLLIRLTTDRALIARTPLIYQRTRSRGTMISEIVGPGKARVQVTDFHDIPDRDVTALGISIAALLRIAGRSDVKVHGRRAPGGANWTVRWRHRSESKRDG